MPIEEALEMFAIFGGFEEKLSIDLFDTVDDILQKNIISSYNIIEGKISPSYLLDKPYRDILIAIARGDGKVLNIFKRARLSESVGGDILIELERLNIVEIVQSREQPLKIHPKQKIKKNLRSYRIQPKVHFKIPFLRFWFGFVEIYKDDLQKGNYKKFWDNYNQHKERCVSLSFEQLSNELIELHFKDIQPLIQKGNFWNRFSEFDILCITNNRNIILGECKSKGRKVCKNELTKLKEKANKSRIRVDTYALFSLSGFSNELLQNRDKNLLLFEGKDFIRLI